jgi:general nucleoside transport system permease protein
VERVSVNTAGSLDIAAPVVVELPASRRARLISGSVLIVAGVLCALAFGVGSKAGHNARFRLSPPGAKFTMPNLVVPARIFALTVGILVAATGFWRIKRGFSRRAMKWVVALTIVGLVFSFLCWSVTGPTATPLDLFGSGGLFGQTIFLAVPLILGALAGVVCERSGVINVAIEGQMLAGAFAGSMFATVAHNAAAGVIGGMLAGAVIAALLAVFAIKYVVNQVVLGVVLNLLALGLTGFLYDAVMAPNADGFNSPGTLHAINIPVLGNIPVIGPLLFDQTIIVYLTYVLIVAVDVVLFRTRWGLRTRAVGEHPKAADTVGINVRRTRYINVLIGGLLAGLAGAVLTVGEGSAFVKNMTGGRGFIALAAVIFGRWSPRGAVGAALLFGFATSVQTVLSFIGTPVAIPSDLLGMLPYLATIFAVAGLVGRVRAPAADGEPYEGR